MRAMPTTRSKPRPSWRPSTRRITREVVQNALQQRVLLYDKQGEEHYNLISALHKSIRNSDADASLYWLGRMLRAGEDPMYMARRLVRMAVEDIGLAAPEALEPDADGARRDGFSGFAGGRPGAGPGGGLPGAGAQVERPLHRLRSSHGGD